MAGQHFPVGEYCLTFRNKMGGQIGKKITISANHTEEDLPEIVLQWLPEYSGADSFVITKVIRVGDLKRDSR